MNYTKKDNADTIHYILTFFLFILLVVSFATHLFTGQPALLKFDSLAGSLMLGNVFLLYAVWFVYEDVVANNIRVPVAIKTNLKNPTIICIILYWIVLIIIPLLF